MTSPFTEIIRHGAVLCDTGHKTPTSDLRTLLLSRLQWFHVAVGRSSTPADDQEVGLDGLQLRTAKEALFVLRKAQEALATSERDDMAEGEASAPSFAVGTRDLSTVRTLLSLVFKWGVEPPYARILGLWPAAPRSQVPKIMDVTASSHEHAVLLDIVSDIFTLLYPHGAAGEVSGTLVTVALLEQHLTDLLRPCLALGWLPKRLATPAIPVADTLRPMVMRLLASLPSFQTIPALGAVMDGKPEIPIHARKACASLLSRQVLRPDGLHGLYSAIFGSEDGRQDEAPLEKLEEVYHVLAAVPSHLTPEDYFSVMLPRLLTDLEAPSSSRQSIHTRASAFVLSRMITSRANNSQRDPVTDILLASLHVPFTQGMRMDDPPVSDDSLAMRSPEGIITALVTLIANCDPSPSIFSALLSPIVPALYAILSVLEEKKTSDPLLRDSISGLLASWGRIVDASEGVQMLWTIIANFDDAWRLDDAGRLVRDPGAQNSNRGLTMFTPDSVRQAEEAGDFDVDANLLHLRPDPLAFVTYVKSIRRPDIASDLFVRLLESYQSSKVDNTSDPLRTLLFLQLIVQMQAHIPPGSSHSDILKRPVQLLSFIKTVLESARADATSTVDMRAERREHAVRIADLCIVEETDEDAASDSDDEDAETVDEEMITTAINLLLSILENHTELSVRNTPILNDIFDLMEPLASEGSAVVKPLAREARLVITARLASTSTLGSSPRQGRTGDAESPRETYQRALKLLQDPILPVRAHGLLLLRELVSKPPDKQGSPEDVATMRAFVPAVLSIFLQSLQDEDSYIYLNAVQGLSAMVETFGKEVLSALVADYSSGFESIGALSPSRSQMDLRVRLGEALNQVIRRCGSALGVHAGLIIPRLFGVARASHFPATLRVSALSLLATCVSTYFLAVVEYASDLAEAMIELLQLQAGTATETSPTDSMDVNPASTNSHVAPMRRGALHLLSLLIRGCIEHNAAHVFDPALLGRMRVTLRYVASTDTDQVCKIQARETLDALHVLQGVE